MTSKQSKERASFTRYSSEFDGPRQYYADDGSEVPIKPLEDNTMTHKPSYDIEVKDRSPNYPGRKYNEFHVYYDIHTQIAHFKTRSYWLGWCFAVSVCLGHKLTTWLRLTGRQS